MVQDGTASDHNVGFVVQDRLDKFCDISAEILIVPVRIYQNIGAVCQRVLRAALECSGQTSVRSQGDDMAYPKRTCDLYRLVGGSVIHDHDFDRINSINY